MEAPAESLRRVHERLKTAAEVNILLFHGPAAEAEAEATEDEPEASSRKRTGSASRSDSFWTTLGKTVIRTVVPAATRMLEQQIRRGTLGGIKRR